MTLRRLTALVAFPLVLVACADAPVGPGDAIDHGTTADELLVRVEFEGGFVAPTWTYTSIPTFSLYGDGTVILPGAQIELYPGPALPAISTRAVGEGGVQRILDEVLSAIERVPDEMVDMGSIGVADAPTTVVTVHAGGVDRTIEAYALGELSEQPDGMSDEEFRARRRLQELVTTLGSLETWIPAGALGPETAYHGSAARLFVSEYRQVDLPQEPVAWPLEGGLGRFGAPIDGSGTYRCGVVAAADWRVVREATSRGNELTPWTDGSARFSVLFRPLLPDETGC